MNYPLLAVIAVFIIGLAIWITIGSKKKTWYKVYLANNDVMLLYRDLNERWWRTSDRYMRFKNDQNQEVTFPSSAHWILMMVAVSEADVQKVREEIAHMKTEMAKELK